MEHKFDDDLSKDVDYHFYRTIDCLFFTKYSTRLSNIVVDAIRSTKIQVMNELKDATRQYRNSDNRWRNDCDWSDTSSFYDHPNMGNDTKEILMFRFSKNMLSVN